MRKLREEILLEKGRRVILNLEVHTLIFIILNKCFKLVVDIYVFFLGVLLKSTSKIHIFQHRNCATSLKKPRQVPTTYNHCNTVTLIDFVKVILKVF